jgi:Fur family transcriptional regulator, zinc uptake regulator
LFPAPEHNHGSCLEAAVTRAEQAFEANGLRLTQLRRKVLEEIAASHYAVGAYEVLERLAAKGQRLAPISVYRAIDSLLHAGVVHRLESRNAFFACHAPHAVAKDQERANGNVILACDSCSLVAEIEGTGIFDALAQSAAGAHFKTVRQVVEINGLCRHCQDMAPRLGGER